MTNAARTAVAVLLLAAIGAALFMIPRGDAPRTAGEVPAVVEHEDGGLVLTFHVMTGTFGLFDAKADPAKLSNLAKARPADVERLRAALTKKLGLTSLEALRHASREQLESLHKLGYF